MILAALLSFGALVLLAGLIFHLAVFALPVFVGIAAASFAHGSGAGLFGAAVAGLAAGALTQATGQTAFAIVRAPLPRMLIVALFATLAAVAGYAIVGHVAALAVPGAIWKTLFSCAGALATGSVAWQRLTLAAPTGRTGQGIVAAD